MNTIQQIQSFLQKEKIDATFITTPDNIFYFSQFKSDPHERLLGLFIFSQGNPLLICPKMEVSNAKQANPSIEIIGYEDIDNPWEMLSQSTHHKNLSLSSIAIEKSHMTIERFESLQTVFPEAHFLRIDEQINQMRIIKSEKELQKMREAAKLADYAIQVGCDAISEGKTEMELLTIIENAIKQKGYRMSFDTIVLSGPNAASPHGIPGNRKIKKGDLVLFDLGVIYEGYCSDITRTVAFGEINDEQKHIYETVLSANQHAIEKIKPNVRAKELDTTAREIIENAGYGPNFSHRLGHGLGISVHEFPAITSTNEMELKPGTVFTVEPGIYVENVAGVRIEDDVVVTESGVEVLTKFPKELIIIPYK